MPAVNPKVEQELSRKTGESFEGKTYGKEVETKNPFYYYDTHILDAAVVPVTLFNNAIARNLSQTNYPYQQLPAGQSFDITGMRVSYYSHALAADATQQLFLDWINNVTVQVQIVNKVPSFERNLAALLGGQVQMVTAPALTVGSRNLSVWTGNTLVKFKEKIYVDRQTPWFVRLQRDVANNAALTGDWLRVEMQGILRQQT